MIARDSLPSDGLRARWVELAWPVFAYAWVGLSLGVPLVLIATTLVEDGRFDTSAWQRVFGAPASGDSSPLWARLIPGTLVAIGVAVPALLAIAAPIAWCWTRMRLAGTRVVTLLLVLVALWPFYIVAATGIDLVGFLTLRGSAVAVGALHAVAYLPIAVLLIGTAMRRVPRSLEESIELEGAGKLRHAAFVARCALPSMLAAALFTVLGVASDYTASNLLLVPTYAEAVLEQFTIHGRPEEPALVGLPLLVILAPLLWLLASPCLDAIAAGGAPPKRYEAGAAHWPLSVALLAVAALLACGPLIFIATRVDFARPLADYLDLFADEIITSSWTAGAAGIIAALVGHFLAWRLVRSSRSAWLRAWVIMALTLPPPLVGIGLIEILNRDGLAGWIYDSPLVFVVAWVVRFLPIATVLALPAVRAVPRVLEDAARLDGYSSARVWTRVVLPSCARSIAVAALVATALSIGELPASNLVMPPGYSTVGSRFFSLVHYGLAGQAAALAAMAAVAVLVPWILIAFAARRTLAR